jgi:hypothetical protein
VFPFQPFFKLHWSGTICLEDRKYSGTGTFCYTDTVLQNVRTVLGHEISLRLEPGRKLSSKDMSVKIIFNIIRYPIPRCSYMRIYKKEIVWVPLVLVGENAVDKWRAGLGEEEGNHNHLTNPTTINARYGGLDWGRRKGTTTISPTLPQSMPGMEGWTGGGGREPQSSHQPYHNQCQVSHTEMEYISRGRTFGYFVTIRTEASMLDITVARLQSTRVQTPFSPLF